MADQLEEGEILINSEDSDIEICSGAQSNILDNEMEVDRIIEEINVTLNFL